MFGIMIADDEILEREVYKVLLGRHFPEIMVVGEVETGRQAIELFDKHRPELALMDVKMPGINGIEAIQEIKKRSSSVKIIIISAYNFFDYAKEALKYGVEDYLLKPVAKDEFIRVISGVVKKIDDEMRINKEGLAMREKMRSILPVLENELTLAVMMGDDAKTEQYAGLLGMDVSSGYVVVGMINEDSMESEDELLKNFTLRKIHDYSKENMPELKPVLISNFISNKMVFIFPLLEVEQIHEAKDIAYRRAVRIRDAVRENFGVKMNFGIGEAYTGVSKIKHSYNQALTVINNIESFGMDIVHYGDIKSGISRQFQYPYDLEKQLLEKIRLGLTEQSIHVFIKIFDYTVECFEDNAGKVKFELLELYFVLSRMIYETDYMDTELKEFVMSKEEYFNLSSIQEIYRTFEEDIKYICGRFKDARNKRVKGIIYDAVRYIKENYRQELTLEEVAKRVCVNPNYFSRIFKNEINKSFIDFLTHIRVEAAKELILKTNKSIRDICWEVGYNDPNYFTKVFKKVSHVTPTEFKEQSMSRDKTKR